MATVKKLATYADIESLPEHLIGEIIDGDLIVSPRPRPQHAHVIACCLGDLMDPFHHGRGGPGGWILLPEPELHLADHVLVPDVAGWRTERLPTLAATAFIEVAPNWVCEVLSPSTAAVDRSKKLSIYGEQGVDHVWFADPLLRMLEVYRWTGSAWLVAGMHTDAARARIEPFGEIELDLGPWWPPLPPGAAAEPPISWTAGAAR